MELILIIINSLDLILNNNTIEVLFNVIDDKNFRITDHAKSKELVNKEFNNIYASWNKYRQEEAQKVANIFG